MCFIIPQGSLFICSIGIGLGMAALLLELTCGLITKDDPGLPPDEELFKRKAMRRMSKVIFEE